MKPGLFSDQVFLCSLRKDPLILLALFYSEGAAATDSQQQLKNK